MSVDLNRANWFKSSWSQPEKDCVEVARLDAGLVGVRDSKDATSPVLVFDDSAWSAFLGATRGGRFQ